MLQTIGKILEIILDGAESTAYIWNELSPAPYRGMHRMLNPGMKRDDLPTPETERELRIKERQRFYSTLNYLKRAGFIKKNDASVETLWSATKLGAIRHRQLKSNTHHLGKRRAYEREATQDSIIVTFDIPETSHRERSWLRNTLKFLDYKMLQKSVWIGKTKIPEKLIDELRQKGILKHVDIFKVGEAGTLNRLNKKK